MSDQDFFDENEFVEVEGKTLEELKHLLDWSNVGVEQRKEEVSHVRECLEESESDLGFALAENRRILEAIEEATDELDSQK